MRNARRLAAEGLGTAALLVVVVGSGIMGERLAQGNAAIALLANSIATGCGLAVLITVLGPVSGAHFNPVVSLVAAIDGDLSWGDALAYASVQAVMAILGVAVAHLMFDLPLFTASSKVRAGIGQWLAEGVATFGLLTVILGCVRQGLAWTPLAVAAYITGAYWFTASTSFANPAVTVARSMTDTFAGINPGNAPAFILAQVVGALAAMLLVRWLWPRPGA